MSTTVSYKGNTIATLSNETKTLTTAGTWVEADIVVTDSGGSSTAIITDTTDAAGGTVRTITTTNEVHLQTKTITPTSSQQTVLPDTGYDGFSSVIVGASSGGTPSATAHTIYFEFSDNTNSTITAYYDNSFISNAITATTPTTYNNKTVTLAQLDGVAWYNPADIPLNTELIDFTKVTENMAINAQGQAVEAQYYSISDYTPIDSSMTFTAVGLRWYYIGFYDENYDVEGALYIDNISGTVLSNNNFKEFTLNSTNIPSGAKYCRITSGMNQQGTILSLIRTA